MSVQNALKLIRQYSAEKNERLTVFATLQDLVDISAQENLPCSTEELKKAFQIDWDMRWLKHS